MRIKYQISDGSVLCIGSFKNISPGIGEAIENYSGEIPSQRIDFYKRIGFNQIREKSQIEKDAILSSEKRFTKERIKAYINQGATLQEKFDKLLNVIAVLGQSVKESEI